MASGHYILAQVFLVILGFLWCKEVLGRFRSDLTDFKETRDSGLKGAIVFYWVLTLLIMIVMAIFLWNAGSQTIGAFR